MKAYREEIIHWFTTPKKLRELASEMERKFLELSWGQSNVTGFIYGDGFNIHVHGEQSAFEDHKRGNPSRWS